MLAVATHSGSLALGPSLVSGGNGKRRPRRYHCMNDVSVYLGRQRVEGRGGPIQSHALCINEHPKD